MTYAHPYASSPYANAFAPLYEPLFLKETQSYILKRPIPGTEYYDAMGCYPLTPFLTTDGLENDFAALKEQGILSLVLVTDPFFCPPVDMLERAFTHVRAYKDHYVCDFGMPRVYSKHHRYEIRRALKSVEVRRIELSEYIDAWMTLYRALIDKHDITGIQAFTKEYFMGIGALKPIMFGAFSESELVSAHIWFEYEGYVYSHLAASSEKGYTLRAAYGVMDRSLQYFSEQHASIVDLGAAPDTGETSLAFFKEGFSNASRPCYLCGKIFDFPLYEKLSINKVTSFFPAYRS